MKQICSCFNLEFYSQYQVSYSDEGQMFVEFVIQNQFFSFSLEEFAQILDIPCEGACVFTDRWRLDELAYGIPSDGPYQTNLPSIEDIISSIRINRDGQVRRIRHEEEIDVLEYQVLTRKIEPTLKPLEEIIQENIFCLGGAKKPEEIVAREEVIILLLLLPPCDHHSSSHLNDVEMMGMTVGSRMQVTTSPFVCSLLYQSGP
ncbi:hypothetical protein Tco_1220009 [Tanacetum coccineum]